MATALKDEARAVREVLKEKLGSQKFHIWFENSTRFTLDKDYLKVEAANPFIANWLESHFFNDIVFAVTKTTGQSKKLTFTINPELSGHKKVSNFSTSEIAPENAAKTQSGKLNLTSGAGVTIKSRRLKKSKPLKLSLNDFVVGKSNELAYNAAKAVAREKDSPFNPLFIHGGYGVGKTHLLQGICNEVDQCRKGTNWLYMSAEQFANQFILSLKTKKLESFRSKLRKVDLLAIDDIHFLANKTSTQEEFLHTFNSIDLAGKQVVLVSDAHPKLIDQLSEKLVNRFVSGMVVKVDPPDLKTRYEICRRYALKMSKKIPESILKYIAENVKNNVRELEGAMIKVVAFASLQNQKLSLALTREILDEHVSRTDPIVHISDIEATVAEFFSITPSVIHSSKKDRTVTLARHFSMYLARKHTKMSTPEIGRCMGNKNHATVLLACRKVDEYLKSNKQLNWRNDDGNKVGKARSIVLELETSIKA